MESKQEASNILKNVLVLKLVGGNGYYVYYALHYICMIHTHSF